MEETISLKEIVRALKKHVALIITTLLITIAISASYTFFVATPQYEATTQILINQTQTSDQPITANELQSNRELINTYNVIMTSPIILNEVIQETNSQMETNELQEKISVSSEEESQVVTLTVNDPDPNVATNIANTTASIFEQEVTGIMNIDNVSILSEAQLGDNENPISPQPVLNLLIGLFSGAVIGIGLAFLIEFLDQTVKTEEDVEKALNLPILGSIAFIDKEINDIGTFTRANRDAKGNRKSS